MLHTAGCHDDKTVIKCLLCFNVVLKPKSDPAKQGKSDVDFGMQRNGGCYTARSFWSQVIHHMTTKDVRMSLRKALSFYIFVLFNSTVAAALTLMNMNSDV